MPESVQVSNAGRLKYADPKDLPSFPSAGLSENAAAASAAATLGWANQKSPEPWRPEKAPSASAAAVLAKDYKPPPIWEPSSSTGASKAALLAVGSATAALKQAPSTPTKSAYDNWGNSAATQAFHASRPVSATAPNLAGGGTAATQAFHTNRASTQPTAAQSTTPDKSIEQRSLAAAKGAMASSRLDSAQPTSTHNHHSTPKASAASNALNGAALAHRNSLMTHKSTIDQPGASPIANMNRNMFISHPPVKTETDEERIHNTAVEMAKKMFQQQQKMVDQTKDAQKDQESTPLAGTYLNLQDAAYKQAQERLAKLHDEHQQNREAQEYYGNASSPRLKFSMSKKLRRIANSDPDPDDKVRSENIRHQMSMFSTKLSQVDTEKRAKDREALLAAAHRNVKARLQNMDEMAYNETGKRHSMFTGWETKAQQAAQSRSDMRTQNYGKIDIGGGKFMTQEEVDAIAAKRLQPMLDDINEKAEAERDRLATLKAEEDARREEQNRIKAAGRTGKEEARKAKEQEKARRAEEKQEAKAKKEEEKLEAKAKKDEEKARKAQEKADQQRAKEEKRKPKLGGAAVAPTTEEHAETAPGTRPSHDSHSTAGAEDVDSDGLLDTEHEHEAHPGVAEAASSHAVESTDSVPRKSAEGSSSSQKSKSGVKSWLKKRFSVARSKNEMAAEKDRSENRRSFFGGSSKPKASNVSNTSLGRRSSSIRDVALAGRSEPEETADKATETAETTAEKLKSAESSLAKTESIAESSLAKTEPIAESSLAKTESIAESSLAKTEPLAESPLEKTEPIAESPLEKTGPIAESPLEKTGPIAENPLEQTEPIVETPAVKDIEETHKFPALEIEEPEATKAASSAAAAATDTLPKVVTTAEPPDSCDVSPLTTPIEVSEERSRTLEPPKPLEDLPRRSSSVARDSRFKEEM